MYFAQKGARCVATAYCPKMVQIALKLAARNGVKIEVCTVNATALPFADHIMQRLCWNLAVVAEK